jgi:hypothetical protein
MVGAVFPAVKGYIAFLAVLQFAAPYFTCCARNKISKRMD